MLLGAEAFYDFLIDGCIKAQSGGPTLKNTVFGWIVSGRYKSIENSTDKATALVSLNQEPCQIDTIVRKFWELEDIPNAPDSTIYTPEQLLGEKSFVQTIARLPSGRFSVSLPFKSSPNELGSSFETTRRRF